MFPRWLIVVLFFLNGWTTAAQQFRFRVSTSVPLIKNDTLKTNAFAGGLDAPQFSKINLNNDTIEDLIVFDRTHNKVSTFLAIRQSDGKFQWIYSPDYERFFPKDLDSWMLLADYDGDGRKDLFTRGTGGVRVFKNIPTTDGFTWAVAASPLFSQGFSGRINISVPASDIPAIIDIDKDGDLDFLAFDLSGNFVEFHKNLSIERTGKAALDFQKIGYCWGNFIKEHCRDVCFNINCETGLANCPAIGFSERNPGGRPLHAGNSLTLFDYSGDGLPDVLYGHITCQNLFFMPNVGTNQKSVFQEVSFDFPAQKPANFSTFPAAYVDDFDFDGLPDLLVAPNVYADDATRAITFGESAWLYQNKGITSKPNWVFQQKDFLQNTMLDLGQRAAPALADLDGDGDTDLLIGSVGRRTSRGFRAGITHYKNTGTPQVPRFEWQTDDFLGITESLQTNEQILPTDLRVFIQDITGDGVPDLYFTMETFLGTQLRFLPNKGIKKGAYSLNINNLQKINLPENWQREDTPIVFDFDNDGRLDLLVGNLYGGVRLHKNEGSNLQPSYTAPLVNFGGLKDDFINRGFGINIADFNGDTKPDLITARADGTLRVYEDFLGQNTSVFRADTNLIINDLRLGGNAFIATGDLNADGLPDLVVGTTAGGIRLLFNESLRKKVETVFPEDGVKIAPNPAQNFFTITTELNATMALLSSDGKQIFEGLLNALEEKIVDTRSLPTGVYVLRVQHALGVFSRKIIIR